MLSLGGINNLVRAYDQNHDLLLKMVGADDFDSNSFNQLIGRRASIVEEILDMTLPEKHLRPIYEKHQELENVFEHTRGQLYVQLKQMDTGKKALKAYR